MRDKINSDPKYQIGVIAVLVLLGAILFISKSGGGEEPEETATTEATVAVALLSTAMAYADNTWQLATDDAHLTLSVVNDRPVISQLSNPQQNWNWTPDPVAFPLLAKVATLPPGTSDIGQAVPQPVTWKFADAAVEDEGRKVTLRFVSATPKLELKSVW